MSASSEQDEEYEDTRSGVVVGADCNVEDSPFDICWDDSNYATCSNGQWIVRPCAAGTSCQESGNGVYCG